MFGRCYGDQIISVPNDGFDITETLTNGPDVPVPVSVYLGFLALSPRTSFHVNHADLQLSKRVGRKFTLVAHTSCL